MNEPITRQGHTRLIISGRRIPTGQNWHMSFDPGEKTGWASFDQLGNATDSGIILNGLHGVSDFLCGLRNAPKVMIVETYRIKNFQHEHNMSTVPTIRILGVLEAYAYKESALWYEQESSVYKTGMRWAGMSVLAKGHTPDDQSAIGHGVYWLHKNGLWPIDL